MVTARCITWTILVTILLAATAAASEPTVTAVSPVRDDDGRLACRLLADGLPGERIESSLLSGIVSAVDLDVDVLDVRDRRIARARVTLLLAFDLWDETYTVRVDGAEHRLPDLEGLRAWLSRPPALPLLPLADLRAAEAPLSMRAALTLHPIAPKDRRRVRDVIAGSGADDRREATVSLGRLIRFFHRDGDETVDPGGTVRSRPFLLEELGHALDP